MTILGNCLPPKKISSGIYWRTLSSNVSWILFSGKFFFRQSWVEVYLQIFFGRVFFGRFVHQIFFLVGGSFDFFLVGSLRLTQTPFMYCFFSSESLSESESDSVWVRVSQRNYPKKNTCKFGRNTYSKQKLRTKNMYQKSLKRNHCQKSLQRNLYPKSQKNNYRPNKLDEFFSSKKNLKRKNTKKSLKRNHYPKISEKIRTKESLKRHSQPKDWEKESLPKKSEDLILTKMPSKTFLLKNLWREIRAKQISIETCIKKILDETRPPQTLWREVCTKQFSQETTTKKMKKSTKSSW